MQEGIFMQSTIPMLIILVVMIAFIFFSSRSQKKQERQVEEMRNNLAVGDEVTTIGGIIGRVVSIKDETCVIETSRECSKIRILKSAIRTVDVKAEDVAAEAQN
ncbi:MAG: preprotein translocase subunit YajC [Clostridiales bacterium]|nr:preprotein translocase subunit YajC [Clostridiales bacterium]